MINYKTNYPISVEQFIALLNKTTLGARRPLEDEKRVAAMLHHADLLVTAWDRERLVTILFLVLGKRTILGSPNL